MTTSPSTFTFQTSPRMVCEAGGVGRAGALSRELGASHVLVVTAPYLARTPGCTRLLQSLEQAGLFVTLYSEVEADPPQAIVEAAGRLARGAGCDLVIGFGGGSSMDTAKLVAWLACNEGPLDPVFGVHLLSGRRLPLIQIPTTAGTGSEVTPVAIVTTPDQQKKGVVSPLLLADVALLDASLTVDLPPAPTAMTGIDAMVHAIEAYTSRHAKNPVSDALAVRALSLLYRHLPRALDAPDDLRARQAMLLGAYLAGMAFANAPVAAVHALAYPLGGRFHVPHGLSNSLVLVPVLRFNLPAAADCYAELGQTLGVAPAGSDAHEQALAFVQAMADLVARMPYAQNLRSVGVTQADLPHLARDAMQVQRLLVNNPREVSERDALALYESAY